MTEQISQGHDIASDILDIGFCKWDVVLQLGCPQVVQNHLYRNQKRAIHAQNIGRLVRHLRQIDRVGLSNDLNFPRDDLDNTQRTLNPFLSILWLSAGAKRYSSGVNSIISAKILLPGHSGHLVLHLHFQSILPWGFNPRTTLQWSSHCLNGAWARALTQPDAWRSCSVSHSAGTLCPQSALRSFTHSCSGSVWAPLHAHRLWSWRAYYRAENPQHHTRIPETTPVRNYSWARDERERHGRCRHILAYKNVL